MARRYGVVIEHRITLLVVQPDILRLVIVKMWSKEFYAGTLPPLFRVGLINKISILGCLEKFVVIDLISEGSEYL